MKRTVGRVLAGAFVWASTTLAAWLTVTGLIAAAALPGLWAVAFGLLALATAAAFAALLWLNGVAWGVR